MKVYGENSFLMADCMFRDCSEGASVDAIVEIGHDPIRINPIYVSARPEHFSTGGVLRRREGDLFQ